MDGMRCAAKRLIDLIPQLIRIAIRTPIVARRASLPVHHWRVCPNSGAKFGCALRRVGSQSEPLKTQLRDDLPIPTWVSKFSGNGPSIREH